MSRLYMFLWLVLAITAVQSASPGEIGNLSLIAVHPETRDLYIATKTHLLHMTENFTSVRNETLFINGREPLAIGIDVNGHRVLACWYHKKCAQFNSSNIELLQWCNGSHPECLVTSRSYFVFLGNDTVLVASSTKDSPGNTTILSLRKMSSNPFNMDGQGDLPRVTITSRCNQFVEFMSGFKWKKFVYFLTQQPTPDYNGRNITVLIRVNSSAHSFYPVKEITIDCLGESSLPGTYQVPSDIIYVSPLEKTINQSLAITLCGYNMSTIDSLLDKASKGNNSMNPPWLCSECTTEEHTCNNSVRASVTAPVDQMVQLKYIPTGSDPGLSDNESFLLFRDEGNGKILDYYSGEFTQDDCKNNNGSEAGGPYYWCNDICTRNTSECPGNSTCEDCDRVEDYTCEECQQHNNTMTPLYWCGGRCTGSSLCNQSCKVDDFFPKSGPRAEGRIITLMGCGLEDIVVKFKDIDCEKMNSTTSTHICKLGEYQYFDNDDKGTPLPPADVQLISNLNQEGSDCKKYTVKPNPNITDIRPRGIFRGVNADLTIRGQGFNITKNGSFMSKGHNGTNSSKTACDVKNDTVMFCQILPEFESEGYPVNASLYFSLENVRITGFIDLYDRPSFRENTEQEQEIVDGDQNLTLAGDFDGVQQEDVRFTISSLDCQYVAIENNNTILLCGIPWDELKTNGKSGKQEVFVSIRNGGNHTFEINIKLDGNPTPNSQFTNVMIGVASSFGVGFGLLIVCGCLQCWRMQSKRVQNNLGPATSSTKFDEKFLHTYFELQPRQKLPDETMQNIVDSKLMIPAERLKLGEQIGSGNFGCVYIGDLFMDSQEDKSETVAVKTIHEGNLDLKSFVEEALMMKEFHHKNVLQLLGISVNEDHQPMVVLPFMANGDLLSYIVDVKKGMSLSTVLMWGVDIAEGMEYLSQLKLVHRDLAARNCMLDEELSVKVADFGLSRDIYEQGQYTSDNKKKLPIRWMAPESMDRGVYTSKSDVWSLGVVLWEILTRGATPYPGVEGWDISLFLRKGRRLQQPWFCSGKLYDIMLEMWSLDPNQRPTFSTVAEMLTDLLQTCSQHEVTSQSLDDEYVTFPDCCRYVQLPDLDYFVLEPEAGREPAAEGMEQVVVVPQQHGAHTEPDVVVVQPDVAVFYSDRET